MTKKLSLFKDADLMTDKIMFDLRMLGYKPGDKLPSIRDFSRKYGLSHHHAGKAVRKLESMEFVSAKDRSGYYIKNIATQPNRSLVNKVSLILPGAEDRQAVSSSVMTRYYEFEARKVKIPFQLTITQRSVEVEKKILESLLDDRGAAAIFFTPAHSANNVLVNQAMRDRRKWIFVDKRPSEIEADFVGTDNFLFGTLAAEALFNCPGSGPWIYIGYQDRYAEAARMKRLGFLASAPAGKEKPVEILFGEEEVDQPDKIQKAIGRLINKKPKIFASSRHFTITTLRCLKKLRPLRDYYLVGSDYYEDEDPLSVTSVQQPKGLEAQLVFDWLLNQQEDYRKMQIFLEPKLKLGDTTEIKPVV